MSVTSVPIADQHRYFEQIERLVQSHTLRRAESLCRLLRYLAEHEFSSPGIALKEYQIATEVLGRPEDFDPQADSAVRVQAGRLRLKLAEYYNHEGVNDTIIVEVPHGAYTVNFQERGAAPSPSASIPVCTPPSVDGRPDREGLPQRPARHSTIAVAVVSSLLSLALRN